MRNMKTESVLFIIYIARKVNCLSLICLAHHIDYLVRGETKNDSEFNKIYIHILHTAINEKMVKYDELKRTDDYKNKKLIQRALDSY